MLKFICPFLILFALSIDLLAQPKEVPYNHVLSNDELIECLKSTDFPELETVKRIWNDGHKAEALDELAAYFKEQFASRYFFSWKNFDYRFKEYNTMYSGRQESHAKEAALHMELYPAFTTWKIGFRNLKGQAVTSYPYRHLARQHKAPSIALTYFYSGDKTYLNYIPEQARSLNLAFNRNEYELIEDGNGAYEAYRAGNRMFNWLQAHQFLLASPYYSTTQQLEMLRTFVHTAAQLNHFNDRYVEGNHQTRGMSALAMLSILLPEFQGAEKWRERAFKRLQEHLEKEIYPDGFQFERTVHYHIDDIENYFYPWQLARINGVQLDSIWDNRMRGLFDVLLKIAMPNKKAPVLQDDTDSPWAEFNEIDETMALGTVLFGEPSYRYFASSKVASEYYWFLKSDQLKQLKTAKKHTPETGSCCLPYSGYYVMRNGWDEDDSYLIVSAGITPEKPDHQHGDMLGIQAYANENILLPNYQVRYYLSDLQEFKNSWTKSVALVDSIPHGRRWKGNKGGSGFGKFSQLPVPDVLAWTTSEDFDFFAGSHNGYEDLGVRSYRSVCFVKDEFWLVRDHFEAQTGTHSSQQVWQGHYDIEGLGQHVRSVFPNGAGLEIVQLGSLADTIVKASARSKGRVVFSKQWSGSTNWYTLLFPFEDFDERLTIDNYEAFKLDDWRFSSQNNIPESLATDAAGLLYRDGHYLFLDATHFTVGGILLQASRAGDWRVTQQKGKVEVQNCGFEPTELNGFYLKPGETISF